METAVLDLIRRQRPGWSLEGPFYTDPAIYRLELERIVGRHWLYAGHVSRIRKRGEYFLYDVGGESIIVVRGDDDRVHALFNVCRHRGTRICWEASGCEANLVCPYHQWVYRLDGSLKTARLMPEEFDTTRFGLHRAQVRVIEGLIFICLSENPPGLGPLLDDIRPHLEPYRLADAKICHAEEYDLRANWKLLAENFRECYHCAGNHPALCRLMPHINLTSPAMTEDFQRRVEAAREQWDRKGVPTRNVPVSAEHGHHVMRFPFMNGAVSQSLDGGPVSPLMGRLTEPDVGVLAASGPGYWFELSGDYALLMRLTPAATDLTQVRMEWLVRGDAEEGRDFDVERVTGFWRKTLPEDWALCENGQRGVASRRYEPGPYAPGVDANSSLGEKGPRAFVEWYLREMALQERGA